MQILLSKLYELVEVLKSDRSPNRLIEECAWIMLTQYILNSGSSRYQIEEIEFYLNNNQSHRDPYAHSVQYPHSVKLKQGVVGSWYFHRFKKIISYTHTRRGLDLTLGDGKAGVFGGILIRALRGFRDDKIISGPSNVVELLLGDADSPAVIEKAATVVQAGYAFKRETGLYLNQKHSQVGGAVFKSARIGLREKDEDFRLRPYRFFTHLDRRKQPPGGQTLVRNPFA